MSARDTSGTLRVLIVEDQTANALALQRILAERDELDVVGHARDLADCLRLCAKAEVVILDLGLPDSPAKQTAATVRAHWPELTLIAWSHDSAAVAHAVENQQIDYIADKEINGSPLSVLLDLYRGRARRRDAADHDGQGSSADHHSMSPEPAEQDPARLL